MKLSIWILCAALLGLGVSGRVEAVDALPAAEERGAEPAGALGLFKAGIKLAQSGDHQAALSRFERARSLSPRWALPHLEIAVAHLMTDNDRQIIGSSLAKAVEYGPEMPRAHYLYGVFLQEEGQRKSAIRHLVRALKIRPSMVDARYRLANLYVEEGKQDRGVEQFEFVLSQRPSHMGAHRNLAMLYEQSGELEKAERHLQAISRLFPANAFHLSNLGQFYRRVGWEKKAALTFRQVDRLEPRRNKKMRPLLKSRH